MVFSVVDLLAWDSDESFSDEGIPKRRRWCRFRVDDGAAPLRSVIRED